MIISFDHIEYLIYKLKLLIYKLWTYFLSISIFESYIIRAEYLLATDERLVTKILFQQYNIEDIWKITVRIRKKPEKISRKK